jgi:hypothetical protein
MNSAAKGRTKSDGKGKVMTVHEGTEEYATSRMVAGSIPNVFYIFVNCNWVDTRWQ